MATITLKDIPDELHQKLRRKAEVHGRSLNKEIIASLEQAVSSKRVELPDYLSRVKRVHDQIDFKVTTKSIQKAIESGRP